MQDFRIKANQIAFTNTETIKAGNVQKAIEYLESKIPYDEFGGNKLLLNPSMSASEINSKIGNMENKGIIIFQEGTYNLERTIYIANKKDLTFVGDGEVSLVGSGGNLLSLENCENIRVYKVDISGGNIQTNNVDGFLLEKCFVDGSLSNQSKNTKVIDCIFTRGITGYSRSDSFTIENTEILDGGLNIYMSYSPDSEEEKAYILNTKIKGESYFSGKKAKFENVVFQDSIMFFGADIQLTSCDFLDEEELLIFVSKLKMENCFINARKSQIDKDSGTSGGASINNSIFMGELTTFSEGFNITNSKILGGLTHGGENSIIEKNIIKSEKAFQEWGYESSLQLLDDNITVKNNEIENSIGLGFGCSGSNCTILNNKISGFSMGVRISSSSLLFQNNIVNSAQGHAGEFVWKNIIISNNTFESVNGCLVMGDNIIFSKNSVISENNGITINAGLNHVFTANIIESGNTGIFIEEGGNHIISNNIIYADTGIHSNKSTKCSITNNIATSIIDDSGSETDPEKGNYYLGNRTDSFELLANNGYENIAIVEDSLQAFANALNYLQNKFN